MLNAYRASGVKLERLGPEADLAAAAWIDLFRPLPGQTAALKAMGYDVPTLEDMEEIEISSRLYREDGVDYLTVVLPGLDDAREQVAGPVTFILGKALLVTVRHHSPRPFETYPTRADKVGPGCANPEHLFLSLCEEIVGRLADILENAGRSLDTVAHEVYADDHSSSEVLREALRRVGREGETISQVRLALLTLQRAISYFGQSLSESQRGEGLRPVVKGLMRDLTALEVHADFLSGRVGLASDATLGMINLSQNQTIKIVSVVAAVFLPPTLIASIYGMNFARMPELAQDWGYPVSLALMFASAAGTYLFFKWKKWL